MFKIILLFCLIVLSSSTPIAEDEADNLRGMDISHLGDKIYGKPIDGKKLDTWTANSPENPEELGEYVEGDILFPNEGRNGLVAESSRWKNGIVPYEITGPYTPKDMETIKKAMDIYHKYTCIRFKERTKDDSDYLVIVNSPTGCWSSVGRISGRQEVNLQSPGCTTKVGTPMHELMHAIGFLHEQNRYERDDHISIAWQNIKKGHENNFDKAAKDTTDGFGVKYDYKSVMHYSDKAFSINGQPTILAKESSAKDKMGQRDGFSRGDIIKINTMYKCTPDSIKNPVPSKKDALVN